MIRKLLILCIGLACAAGASQAPSFSQQYLQRLGGWVDSYEDRVAKLDQRARQFDMTRKQYIDALAASADPKVREEAKNIASWPVYLAQFSEMENMLTNGPAWMRPVRVIQSYLDPAFKPIVAATWKAYKPATQFTPDGAIYGGIGFVIGWILTGIGLNLAATPFRMLKKIRLPRLPGLSRMPWKPKLPKFPSRNSAETDEI